jgi:hypothetical protein
VPAPPIDLVALKEHRARAGAPSPRGHHDVTSVYEIDAGRAASVVGSLPARGRQEDWPGAARPSLRRRPSKGRARRRRGGQRRPVTVPGAEREHRPLPCSDRAGGRGCRERLFRQLGLCLVYAPPLHGESGMMELDDLAQLRPEGLLQSALDIDEQALGERISETGRKPRADGAHREIGARGCCSIFIIAVMCGKVSTARARFSKEKSVANSSRHARIPRSARGDPMRPPRPPRVYVHA